VSFLRTVCAYIVDSETKYWAVLLWILHLLMIALHRIGAHFTDIFAKMQWYPRQRSWCIRFLEMCLEEVTWFFAKHDVEAVKKFSRILLRSCTERIDPVTCQNYFARLVNSARRDFFSRLLSYGRNKSLEYESTLHNQGTNPLSIISSCRDEVIKFDRWLNYKIRQQN